MSRKKGGRRIVDDVYSNLNFVITWFVQHINLVTIAHIAEHLTSEMFSPLQKCDFATIGMKTHSSPSIYQNDAKIMVSKYMIKPKPQPTKVLKVKMYFSSSFMVGQGLHTLNYLIPNLVSLIMPASSSTSVQYAICTKCTTKDLQG